MEGQISRHKGGHVIDLMGCPHLGDIAEQLLDVCVADPGRREFARSGFQHSAQFDELHRGNGFVLALRRGTQNSFQRGPAVQRVNERPAAAFHAENPLRFQGFHGLAHGHPAHLVPGAEFKLPGHAGSGRKVPGNDPVQEFVCNNAHQ